MDCEQFDQIVMDLLYGELSGDERAEEARRHAERCDRCSALLGDMRATRRAVTLPIVEPPSSVDAAVMEAARLAQKGIPWPRRVGRWVSWAGSYAMRPQLAMAALLLLMIGSSLLLIRGRPGSEQVGVLRVTEQGVPEREGAETITPDPTELPMKSGRGLAASSEGDKAGEARGRIGGGAGSPGAAKKGGQPASPDLMDELARAADAGPDGFRVGKGIESPTGNATALQNNMNQRPSATGAGPPAADGYAEAMGLYKAADFANAYRAFDVIAMRGGANAPSAALYAAKAVRNSSGCTTALPRFESVAARYGAAGAGVEAKWEAATCARILGDFTRARILYRELAAIASQRDRAERELARISTQGQNRAAPARSKAPEQRETPDQRAQQNKEEKKPPANADAFDNAY